MPPRHLRRPTQAASDDEIARLVDQQMAHWEEPEATETFDARDVEGAMVVVGDEVARYFDLTKGERRTVDDNLGVLMPPFPRALGRGTRRTQSRERSRVGSGHDGRRGSLGPRRRRRSREEVFADAPYLVTRFHC